MDVYSICARYRYNDESKEATNFVGVLHKKKEEIYILVETHET